MGITLKQIADMAGVHKSTVDKVIHNRPGVSDAKRQQIRALLKEYGYESNPLAKALNYQKKKMTIGVALPRVNATPICGAVLKSCGRTSTASILRLTTAKSTTLMQMSKRSV